MISPGNLELQIEAARVDGNLNIHSALKELRDNRAQLALADKVIQAARRIDDWRKIGGEVYVSEFLEQLRPLIDGLQESIAEYDKERAAP